MQQDFRKGWKQYSLGRDSAATEEPVVSKIDFHPGMNISQQKNE
jgi:hypothetical protein